MTKQPYTTMPLSTLNDGDWATEVDKEEPIYVVSIDAETGYVTLVDHKKDAHIKDIDLTVNDLLVDRINDDVKARARKFNGRPTP